VAMAVYNGETYLPETLEGLKAQTYPNMEVIIVDDGSTDRTAALLDRIGDSRFRAIHLPRNQGAANALNTAIGEAAGDWIAIHDADDVSRPDRLSKQAEYVRSHPGFVAVGSLIRCIPGHEVLPEGFLESTEESFNRYLTPRQIVEARFTDCPLCHGSVLFAKQAFLDVGRYRTSYKIAYDYDLWNRLIGYGPIGKVEEALYLYRVYPSSLSNRKWQDTYGEKLISALQSIREVCYAGHAADPRLAIFAPNWLCRNIRDTVIPATPGTARLYIHDQYVANAPNVSTLYDKRVIDGVLISTLLDKGIIRQLTDTFQSAGMVMNRTLFTV